MRRLKIFDCPILHGKLRCLVLEPTRELVSLDLSGEVTPLGTRPRMYERARFAPDGRKIAVTIMEVDRSDAWMFDVVDKTLVRITSHGTAAFPGWPPTRDRDPGTHLERPAIRGGAAVVRRAAIVRGEAVSRGAADDF